MCVPIAIEDCTEEVKIGFSSFNLLKSWKVEECESVPVEKCVDVRVSAQDQVQWIWCLWTIVSWWAFRRIHKIVQQNVLLHPKRSVTLQHPLPTVGHQAPRWYNQPFMLVPRRKTLKILFLSRMLTVWITVFAATMDAPMFASRVLLLVQMGRVKQWVGNYAQNWVVFLHICP